MSDDLDAAYREEIYRLAVIDGLTQIYNRRYLEEFLEREISCCRRHGRPMSLIMFDIDGFKEINEQFGHLSGDFVLRHVADNSIGEYVGKNFVRFTGDKFIVALPETDLEDALKFADIIRESVEIMPIAFDSWKIPITISVGVGRFDHKMTAPLSLSQMRTVHFLSSQEQGPKRDISIIDRGCDTVYSFCRSVLAVQTPFPCRVVRVSVTRTLLKHHTILSTMASKPY